jgi:multidrug resistance efflux pump
MARKRRSRKQDNLTFPRYILALILSAILIAAFYFWYAPMAWERTVENFKTFEVR